MASPVLVPRLGSSPVPGVITEWYQPDGATVRCGDAVCCIESDYVTFELEAAADGILRHLAHDGWSAGAGEPVALVLAPGERLPHPVKDPALQGSAFVPEPEPPEHIGFDFHAADSEPLVDDSPLPAEALRQPADAGDWTATSESWETPVEDEWQRETSPITFDRLPAEDHPAPVAEAEDSWSAWEQAVSVDDHTDAEAEPAFDVVAPAEVAVEHPTPVAEAEDSWSAWEQAVSVDDRTDAEPAFDVVAPAEVAAEAVTPWESEPTDHVAGQPGEVAVEAARPWDSEPTDLVAARPAADDGASEVPDWATPFEDAPNGADPLPDASEEAPPTDRIHRDHPSLHIVRPDFEPDAEASDLEEQLPNPDAFNWFDPEAPSGFATDEPAAHATADAPSRSAAPLTMRVTAALTEAGKMRDQLAREWASSRTVPSLEDIVVRAAARAISEQSALLPHAGAIGLRALSSSGATIQVVSDAGRRSFHECVAVRPMLPQWDEAEAPCSVTITTLLPFGIDDAVPGLAAGHAVAISLGAPRLAPVAPSEGVLPNAVSTLTLAYDPVAVPEAAAAIFLARLRDLVESPYALLAD